MPNARRIRIIVLLAVLVALAASANYLRSEVMVSRAGRTLQVVTIPLDSGIEIRPALAGGQVGGHEMFSKIVDRLKPYAAINGTFYSEKWVPIGDVLIDGKLEAQGRYPNAIAVRNDGKVEIFRRKGAKFDWTGYKCALAAGPRLVDGGQIMLDPLRDGFKQLSLNISASRSGIGLTKDNKLLLVVCKDPIKLVEFAKIMQDLGAVDALNLDGGPCCGLYHDGKLIVDADASMSNVLAIYKRQ